MGKKRDGMKMVVTITRANFGSLMEGQSTVGLAAAHAETMEGKVGVETAGFPSPEGVGPRSPPQLAAGDPCMSCPFFSTRGSWRAKF